MLTSVICWILEELLYLLLEGKMGTSRSVRFPALEMFFRPNDFGLDDE